MVLVALAAAAVLWRAMLASGRATGFGDWQFFMMMWEASRVAVERHGELPLYNPHHCGGITLWGDPQLQAFSPWFLLVFAIGTGWATKVSVLVHTVIGVVGAYCFARREVGLSRPASWLCAVGWACSGFFTWHGGGGHSAFLPFDYLPWLLLAWRAAALDVRWAVAVAAILALTLSEGGVYPTAYFATALLFDASVRLADPARRRGVLRAAFAVGVVAGPLCAFRALPIYETIRETGGRHVDDVDKVEFPLLAKMLLSRANPWRLDGQQYVWPEYCTFLGPVIVTLGVAGMALASRIRGTRWLLVGALLFGGLMLGQRGSFYPWSILREVPIYASLRVPSRFAVLFTFYFVLLAGVALDRVAALARPYRLGKGLDWIRHAPAVLLLVTGLADVLFQNGRTANLWHDPPQTHEPPARDFYLFDPGDYGRRYAQYPQLNLGSTACYQAFDVRVSPALWSGPGPQWRVADGRATVRETGRTSNTWTLVADARTPATILLNRNYDVRWRTEPPQTEVHEEQGLLALTVPRGRRTVLLRYLPRSLFVGFATTAGGLLLAVALLVFATPPRVARAGAWLRSLFGVHRAPEP